MKYLKEYYLESLKNVRLEDGEEIDCSGKALSWYNLLSFYFENVHQYEY